MFLFLMLTRENSCATGTAKSMCKGMYIGPLQQVSPFMIIMTDKLDDILSPPCLPFRFFLKGLCQGSGWCELLILNSARYCRLRVQRYDFTIYGIMYQLTVTPEVIVNHV